MLYLRCQDGKISQLGKVVNKMTDKISFAVAYKKYFELLPDQKLGQFIAELKNLTQKDREELAPLLAKELGIEVTLTLTN